MPTLLRARPASSPEPVRDGALAALIVALSLSAWAALWAWSASPLARYGLHGGWLDATAFATLCRAVPGGVLLVPALLYALAWVLMIAAMMLPTTYPVLGIFRVMTRSRVDASSLLALVIGGFFAAWFGFGLVAHAIDAALASVGGGSAWLLDHGWVVAFAVLTTAGLFQFSALKYRCLDQCRTPFAFVTTRWHGRAPAREAFRIGIDHGLFCIGCCWALMLCMFVVGTANIGWMLVLGAAMAMEKSLPGGAKLRWPIGLTLLAAAAWVAVERA